MQPGQAQTSSLGVPLLLLARWVGWVAPVCPTHGVLDLSCPSTALRAHVCAVSWATWLLFTGVPARCVALRVWCPGPLRTCSPVCLLGVLFCVSGVLGHLAPVHRCARSVRCIACAVSWATLLLFTGVPAWCVALRVRCPGPLGSCSPMCPLGVLCCVCGVLCHLAPAHRCARTVRCFGCAVSWATWLLFTGLPARCVALRLQGPRPLGSCSPMRPRGLLCCVCAVLGYLAPVHGVPARCVVLLVRCPGLLGSCSPLCLLAALLCVCSVLGHLAPVHRCARSVCSVACAVSWATWFLFTGVSARWVALHVRCPGPLCSCLLVFRLCVLSAVCGILGHFAPVHRCARSVCCVACAVSWANWLLLTGVSALFCCAACAVSWATWLLFTGVPARCVVLRVRCPVTLGSCSPVCQLGALLWVCCVLGHLAPVHRFARSVRCFASAGSTATCLLFADAFTWFVVWRVRCPGPLGSCLPVCPLCVLCCVCGVLGHLVSVPRCGCSVFCFACAVSWATWLLFTGVLARCVVLRVRCPGPLCSCSPLCALRSLLCLCSVLGHLAPVHRCARSVCCVTFAVSWATWLLFTGVRAPSVALLVRCPGPLGSCSPVCPLRVLCNLCGVLGHWAPVHRCARAVLRFACAVSWATWLLFTGVPAQ